MFSLFRPYVILRDIFISKYPGFCNNRTRPSSPLRPPAPLKEMLHNSTVHFCRVVTVSEPSNSLQSQRDLKEGNGACFKSDVHILSASPHLTNVDSQESLERKNTPRAKGDQQITVTAYNPLLSPKQIKITINLGISACSFRLRDLFFFVVQSSKFCDWHTYLVLSGFFSLKVDEPAHIMTVK